MSLWKTFYKTFNDTWKEQRRRQQQAKRLFVLSTFRSAASMLLLLGCYDYYEVLWWSYWQSCYCGTEVANATVAGESKVSTFFFHGARDHLLVLRHILWWLLLKSFYFGTKTGKLGVESNTTWQKGHVAQARQNIGCWLPNHPTTQDCKEDPFDWKVFSSLTSSQRLLFSTKEMRIQRELSHKTESR